MTPLKKDDFKTMTVGQVFLAKGLLLGVDSEGIKLEVLDVKKIGGGWVATFNLSYFEIPLGSVMHSTLEGGSWEWL